MSTPPPEKPRSVLSRFWEFVRLYRALLLYVIGFGAGPWLIEWGLRIGPPWPHSTAVAAFTSVVAMIVLIYSYNQWEHLESAAHRTLIRRLAPVAIVCLVAYIVLKGMFARDAPDYRHQVAAGFILRPEILDVLRANPDKSIQDVLAGAGYDPTHIWVEWTVQVVRVGFLLTWLCFFGYFSFVLAVFVISEVRKELAGQTET